MQLLRGKSLSWKGFTPFMKCAEAKIISAELTTGTQAQVQQQLMTYAVCTSHMHTKILLCLFFVQFLLAGNMAL